MYTAIITNVIPEKLAIRVFVDIKLDGVVSESRSYVVDPTIKKADAVALIKVDVDALNLSVTKANSAQAFVGTVIS